MMNDHQHFFFLFISWCSDARPGPVQRILDGPRKLDHDAVTVAVPDHDYASTSGDPE